MRQPIPRDAITGLVLAGGQGRRMGGQDKGLMLYGGVPLAAHAIERLRPQVGPLLVSANRHAADYAALGCPVCPDEIAGFAGPLAGWQAALQHCTTPYLASVPCDAPRFPADLVARLAQALAEARAEVATAVVINPEGGVPRRQPVFSLLSRTLAPRLRDALRAGERRVSAWIAQQRFVEVRFDDAGAFANLNTLDELTAAQASRA